MEIDFNKGNGLIPAIIQDNISLEVLMLGFMNKEAFEKTVKDKKVCFYSRTKKRLWTKGETSGNYLFVKDIITDCDRDTILVKASPVGPACHKGTDTCFGNRNNKGFLYRLEEIVSERINSNDDSSYTRSIYNEGRNKIAQKVGEEAVELVIEAMDNNDTLLINETADLLYHTLILLNFKGLSLSDIEEELFRRSK